MKVEVVKIQKYNHAPWATMVHFNLSSMFGTFFVYMGVFLAELAISTFVAVAIISSQLVSGQCKQQGEVGAEQGPESFVSFIARKFT